MPYVTVKMEKGGGSSSPVKLSDILRYYRVKGHSEHPTRPRTPATLWIMDVAIEMAKRNFPGQKPIRISIEKRSLLND
jgi:hypothetical protein